MRFSSICSEMFAHKESVTHDYISKTNNDRGRKSNGRGYICGCAGASFRRIHTSHAHLHAILKCVARCSVFQAQFAWEFHSHMHTRHVDAAPAASKRALSWHDDRHADCTRGCPSHCSDWFVVVPFSHPLQRPLCHTAFPRFISFYVFPQ